MYTIKFASSEKRQFEFAYQTLLFPRKELNEQEEIGLRNLLVALETIGVEKPMRLGDDVVAAMTLPPDATQLAVDIADERDFRLLKALVKGATVNGLWVRDKLALLDKLDKAEKDGKDA